MTLPPSFRITDSVETFIPYHLIPFLMLFTVAMNNEISFINIEVAS